MRAAFAEFITKLPKLLWAIIGDKAHRPTAPRPSKGEGLGRAAGVPFADARNKPSSACSIAHPRAVAILRQLEKVKVGEFAFAGQVRNKPLSNMAMEMMLRRMKIKDATVHGFRSSFRDWAGNVSNFPLEVVETALAHVIGDKAEQAIAAATRWRSAGSWWRLGQIIANRRMRGISLKSASVGVQESGSEREAALPPSNAAAANGPLSSLRSGAKCDNFIQDSAVLINSRNPKCP